MSEENQPPDNNYQKEVGRGLAAFALVKLILAIFAWWGRDPEEPVKWGQLRLAFLIEFILLAYVIWRLHWWNVAACG